MAHIKTCDPQSMTDDSNDVTGNELIARARELIPALRERAAEAEQQRFVHHETIENLRAADLFRAYVPKRYGGFEVAPRTFWRIAAEISKGCPSTAWVYSVLSCHTYVFALFPESAQQEVFSANPNVTISGVLPDRSVAERTDDGYVLKNGLWPFGSGCHNADYAMLGASLPGEPPGYDKIFCMIPMSDIEILDDWHVAGLKATGSNSIKLAADELFVPEHMVMQAGTLLAHKFGNSRPQLYRTPGGATLALSLGLGTTIGATEAAFEHYEDLVMNRSDRPMVYTNDVRKASLPSTRRVLAEAVAKLESARLLADKACELAWQAAAESTRVMDNRSRATIRMLGVYAMQQCLDVVEDLFMDSGGSSLHERSPMQRLYRDVHAMNMHEAMHWDTILETYGQLHLNQPTTHWLL